MNASLKIFVSYLLILLGGWLLLCLPNNYSLESIIRVKIWLTLIIESIGAALLYYLFNQAHIENALWQAIFHSISAFCTAGLSLFPDNLESFNSNYLVQFVIISLSAIGALGFIVFSDIYRMLRHRQRKLSITSKIILGMMAFVTIFGTSLLFFAEQALTNHSTMDRFLLSLFHSLSAITTTGFNTLPISSFFPASLFLIFILMFIGRITPVAIGIMLFNKLDEGNGRTKDDVSL